MNATKLNKVRATQSRAANQQIPHLFECSSQLIKFVANHLIYHELNHEKALVRTKQNAHTHFIFNFHNFCPHSTC